MFSFLFLNLVVIVVNIVNIVVDIVVFILLLLIHNTILLQKREDKNSLKNLMV